MIFIRYILIRIKYCIKGRMSEENGLIKYDRMVTGVGGSVGRETGRQIQDKDRQVQE